MNDADQRDRPESKLHFVFGKSLPLEKETCLFILTSALDAFMTYLLLYLYSDDGFHESNPVPKYFLDRWGIPGMMYFKFGLVAFVTVICQIIANSRIDIARRILQFATVLVSCVVIYSLTLLLRYSAI